jgi:hypothetical protein
MPVFEDRAKAFNAICSHLCVEINEERFRGCDRKSNGAQRTGNMKQNLGAHTTDITCRILRLVGFMIALMRFFA